MVRREARDKPGAAAPGIPRCEQAAFRYAVRIDMFAPMNPMEGRHRDDSAAEPEESGAVDSPVSKSRSQKKREAAALGEMGARLVELSDPALNGLPLDSELRAAIVACRPLTKNARNRQLRRIAKLLRERDTGALSAAFESSAQSSRAHIAAEREVEVWRRRLLDEGDDALTRFIAAHPTADRSALRTLMRQVRGSTSQTTRTRASRQLLRVIRELHVTHASD